MAIGKAIPEKAEEILITAYEDLPIIFFSADKNGKLETISPGLKSIGGYSPEEAIGKHLTEFYVRPETNKLLFKYLATKGTVTDFVVEMKHKTGKRVYSVVNARALRNGDNRVTGFVGVMVDVTPLKENETKLKEYIVALEKIIKKRTEELAAEMRELEKRNGQLQNFVEFAVRREKDLGDARKSLAKEKGESARQKKG